MVSLFSFHLLVVYAFFFFPNFNSHTSITPANAKSGTLIPAVRRLFRRPESNSEGTSNDTEYAFFHSKSLVQRVLDSVRGGWSGISRLASATFLVFAVLYVFQNEVTLRVASTLSKRLKRLSSKIENSDSYEMSDKDLALLRGWRWRVLSRS